MYICLWKWLQTILSYAPQGPVGFIDTRKGITLFIATISEIFFRVVSSYLFFFNLLFVTSIDFFSSLCRLPLPCTLIFFAQWAWFLVVHFPICISYQNFPVCVSRTALPSLKLPQLLLFLPLCKKEKQLRIVELVNCCEFCLFFFSTLFLSPTWLHYGDIVIIAFSRLNVFILYSFLLRLYQFILLFFKKQGTSTALKAFL